jgi:cyclomaltodextrinase
MTVNVDTKSQERPTKCLHHESLSILFAMLAMKTSVDSARNPGLKLPLDTDWLFRADPLKVGVDQEWFLDSADRAAWVPLEIPLFWHSYPRLADHDGWNWYTRRFRFEKALNSFSIHVAGVDDNAVVWVNGIEAGTHAGYEDSFVVDVTRALRSGENSIVVLVQGGSGGGGIYRPITLIETRILDQLLRSPYSGKRALHSAAWVCDGLIYSVYLRSFSPKGNFLGLEQRLPELKRLGVTIIWLLPIHPVGLKKRKGKLGSPYAVRDYYGINPEFGTLTDFRRLVKAVHRQRMKLIIDLVANHTSWDSKLITDHPDWFMKDARGQIVSPNVDWTDVADLDYSRPELRRYMIKMMKWWVKDVGIDGFRCDVAELVPTDFWNEARRKLNKIKPVMMLSEGSAPEHHLKAFDVTYSWNIYDAIEPLVKGKRPVALIDQILKREHQHFPTGSLRMRFTTNHDKNPWDAPAVLKFGMNGLKLATVLVNTLPGVPMIYTGEEVANDRRLSLFEKVDVDWSRPRTFELLWRTLSRIRKEHKALSRGEMIRVQTSRDEHVYAFFRLAGNDRILVVLNFSAETTDVNVGLPIERVVPGRKSLVVNDALSGERMVVEKKGMGQLELQLEPYEYRVFVAE